MQDLVIFGAGGFGREVHELIEDVNDNEPTFNILGFLDGNAERHGSIVHQLPVLGDDTWLNQHLGTATAIGVGDPTVKRRLVSKLRAAGAVFPPIVHPRAELGRRVRLSDGVIICKGTLITTDVEIEPYVTLNIDTTIGHDTVIHPYVTVSPGVHISGNVTIGEGCDVGTGATVIQGVSIGEWSVVGASSAVVRDIPANVTAVGVPAKVIKEREAGWHLG